MTFYILQTLRQLTQLNRYYDDCHSDYKMEGFNFEDTDALMHNMTHRLNRSQLSTPNMDALLLGSTPPLSPLPLSPAALDPWTQVHAPVQPPGDYMHLRPLLQVATTTSHEPRLNLGHGDTASPLSPLDLHLPLTQTVQRRGSYSGYSSGSTGYSSGSGPDVNLLVDQNKTLRGQVLCLNAELSSCRCVVTSLPLHTDFLSF